MATDAGSIDEPRMWSAIERLEAASQATREEQVSMNARMDAMREEQVATNARVNAVEREQAVTNTRLDAIEREQIAMNARLDVLTLRIDRLFYAIIGGSIGIIGALIAHALITS